MEEVIVSTSKLKALADVIRLKSGKSDLMNLDSMPRRIRLLPGRVSDEIVVSDLCQGSGTTYRANVRLRALPLLKTTGMTDMSSMCKNLNATSTVAAETANYMIDVSSFDTSSVTNMSSMFEGARGNIEGIFKWDTSNVTNMSSMFKGLDIYTTTSGEVRTLDLDNLDVSSVTDFSYMFSGVAYESSEPRPIFYLDLNNFDTSSATTMDHMFYNFYTYDAPQSGFYGSYLWVPSTFVSTQISNNTLKPFYYTPYQRVSSKLHVYTDATDAVSQGWGTIHSNFDMHYNTTHADFLNIVNS